MRLRATAPVTIAFLAMAAAAAPPPPAPLEASLSAPKREFRQSERVAVTYTLRNAGNVAVRVLKWNTPLESVIYGDPFVVTKDGQLRRYIGPFATRSMPTPDSYVTIEPQGEVSATVDLASVYDLRDAGTYQVQIKRLLLHDVRPVKARLPKSTRELRSATLTARSGVAITMLDAGEPLPAPPPMPGPRVSAAVSPLSTPNCTSSQASVLQASYNQTGSDASTLATAAPTTFGSCGSNYTSLAVSYFGTCNTSALGTLVSVTNGVSNYANGTGTVTMNCGTSPSCNGNCNNNVIAYTCGPSTMYVCPLIFSLPSPYTPEFVIYHEITHWMGTGDFAYGCSACQSLASSTPSEAVANADSYTWYGTSVVKGFNCGVDYGTVVALSLSGILAAFQLRRRGRRAWR